MSFYYASYWDLLEGIMKDGSMIESRGLISRELIDAKLVVPFENLFCTKIARAPGKIFDYLLGELSWYFGGELSSEGIVKYSKFWDQLKDREGNLRSNYGRRIFYTMNSFGLSQFDWIIRSLQKDKYSRQAIMTYHGLDACEPGTKDFICTQTQQFFIRENKLSSIVTIRSSDAIKGLTFDIPWWSLVQQMVRFHTMGQVELGSLTVNIGSSHVYERDFKLVSQILQDDKLSYRMYLNSPIPLGHTQSWYESKLKEYLFGFPVSSKDE